MTTLNTLTNQENIHFYDDADVQINPNSLDFLRLSYDIKSPDIL